MRPRSRRDPQRSQYRLVVIEETAIHGMAPGAARLGLVADLARDLTDDELAAIVDFVRVLRGASRNAPLPIRLAR